MFNFTTTTLINGAKTVGHDSFEVVDNKIFRVFHGPQFKKGDVMAVYKAPYVAEAMDTVEIDLSGLSTTKYYRIAMYIRSVGNADPMYANDFVFKGKPLYIEFKGDAKASDVKAIADKFLLALYDEKIIDLKATSDTKLTVTAINGYQRFHHVALEEWVDAPTTIEGGDWTVKTDFTANVVMGAEGKGTYEQVLKDLRLPTGDHMSFLNRGALQMPVLDGEYVQVTVHMCKLLAGYPGGIGVGNPTKSVTTHVFYINGKDLADDFIAKLKTVIGDDIEVETVPAETPSIETTSILNDEAVTD